MPSLEPDGEKLASLRRALGMTQLELALRAGVSERTIRNSERGHPINHAFLSYIAGALGMPVAEITRPSGELARHARWMKNCATFLTGLQHSMLNRDAKPLAEYLHREFQLHQLGGIPGVETLRIFMGDYRGVGDFDRFVDNTQRFWEQEPGGAITIEAPKGDAETLLVRGYHELRREDGGVAWGRYTYIVDFEGEVIRNVTATIIPCAAPAGVRATAT